METSDSTNVQELRCVDSTGFKPMNDPQSAVLVDHAEAELDF